MTETVAAGSMAVPKAPKAGAAPHRFGPQPSRLPPALLADLGGVSQELYGFWQRRLNACAHALVEFGQCRSFGELWQIQAQFSQAALKAYSDEAMKLAALATRSAKLVADPAERPEQRSH